MNFVEYFYRTSVGKCTDYHSIPTENNDFVKSNKIMKFGETPQK